MRMYSSIKPPDKNGRPSMPHRWHNGRKRRRQRRLIIIRCLLDDSAVSGEKALHLPRPQTSGRAESCALPTRARETTAAAPGPRQYLVRLVCPPLLQEEEEKEEEEEEEGDGEKKKKKKQQPVHFRLLCHLSITFSVFLLILL
ncbi:uncharacterized protein LOC119596847 [Penaeus monodon]|uniref:uncharacterized protein LOC119596847 n=1 Tax=Penaeus monodon TaxID=6687 RepID=UPI0018A6DC26|nr:uncharacterized protein LOC119596847 [Penaeus monodon]